MKAVAALVPAVAGDELELVCPNGHRTTHSGARIKRLNDGWCGKCGAAISYTALSDSGQPAPPISRNERK